MYSDRLLSKQGPLAQVWLAANYDKKLSKQQLLSTNIVQSSSFISNQPLSFASQLLETASSGASTITLRLSGQLLLGIVRIYSRKTKYLLDDVNDTLFKLKNSFKYASGGTILGVDQAAGIINLAPQQTIISNMNNITLADQATDFDLLYQDDLNLDDEVPTSNPASIFSRVNSSNNEEASFNFDQSIEFPRYEHDDYGNTNYDDDIELDFDLGDNDDADQSIEVGRNASHTNIETNEMSIIDGLNDKETNMDTVFGEPLQTVDEINIEANVDSEGPEEPITPPSSAVSRPRKRIVGISETGELKTTKRKLVVDSAEEVETGITAQTLKRIQQIQLSGNLPEEQLTLRLTNAEKMQLIHELSSPVTQANKRRKLWSLDEQLQNRCLELANERAAAETREQTYDDFGDNVDFDLSLPDFDSDSRSPDSGIVEPTSVPDVEEEEERGPENTTKASIQVAGHLRTKFLETNTTDLNELIQTDLQINDENEATLPLGIVHKTSGTINVNKKREATKCFFELLVLATSDCVQLDQEPGSTKSHLGGKINITARDNLFTTFL